MNNTLKIPQCKQIHVTDNVLSFFMQKRWRLTHFLFYFTCATVSPLQYITI